MLLCNLLLDFTQLAILGVRLVIENVIICSHGDIQLRMFETNNFISIYVD